MFAVDDILISDEVPSARFACNLAACHGACCVQGKSGAPLEPEERQVLERLLPAVEDRLRPEARAVIEAHGVWEEVGREEYATACVEDAACVFVTYDGPVARCAIQQAHAEGRLENVPGAADFPKPLSCHLFPLRIARYGEQDVLNYEQIGLCAPARTRGNRQGLALADFARAPLVRKYGLDWYNRFRAACRRRLDSLHPPDSPSPC